MSERYPAPLQPIYIYAVQAINATNNSFTVSYTIGATGGTFGIMIIDPVKAAAFAANYPKATYLTNDNWTQNQEANGMYQTFLAVDNSISPDRCSGCAGH